MDCRGDSVHEGNWHTASLCGCLEDGLQALSFSIHTPESSIQTPGAGVGGLALLRGAVRKGGFLQDSQGFNCVAFFPGALRGVDTQTALLSGTHSEETERQRERQAIAQSHGFIASSSWSSSSSSTSSSYLSPPSLFEPPFNFLSDASDNRIPI